MSDVSKALELYELFATRCEKGRFTQNQAVIYREMVDFLKDCASDEEMNLKLKNSKYYLAPSVAQARDMVFVLSEIAVENDMAELKALCDNELDKISQDETSIYSSSYQIEATAIINKYAKTLEAFLTIFESYMQFKFAEELTDEGVARIHDKLKRAFESLSLPVSDFRELSKIKKFRDLIFLDDREYEDFVNEAETFRTSPPSFEDDLKMALSEAEEFWESIKPQKSEIIATYKDRLEKTRSVLCTVIAPNDKDGKYSFENEEVVL